MITMLVEPPKTLFAVFIKADGKPSSLKPLFKGEVLEGSLFMNTKRRQVYIVYQIPQYAARVTEPSDKLKQYPYVILLTTANATGGLLSLEDPTTTRYLVGYTRERNAHLDGYFDKKNGWYVFFVDVKSLTALEVGRGEGGRCFLTFFKNIQNLNSLKGKLLMITS